MDMSGVHRPSIRTKSTARKLDQPKRNSTTIGSDREISGKSGNEENDRQSRRRKDSGHMDLIERLMIGKITFLFLIP